MVKLKKRKRKPKYNKSSIPVETKKQMRAKLPAKLIKAFIRVKETDFEDAKVYSVYAKLSKEYLGDKASDKIESGRLVVLLTKATMDIFDKKKKARKDIFKFFEKPEKLVCEKHPKYGAIRKPRLQCQTCWDMYNEKKRKTK